MDLRACDAVVTGGASGTGANGIESFVPTHDEGLDPLRRRFARMDRAILDRKS